MLYYDTKDNSGRWWGAISVALYLLLLLLIMFITFSNPAPEGLVGGGGGMMINFGDTDQAAGADDPRESVVSERSEQATGVTDMLTQDFEDAPVVTQQTGTTERPTVAVVERPREVNQQALFPGRNPSSSSTSEGSSSSGRGNEGTLDGSASGAHQGVGGGGVGDGGEGSGSGGGTGVGFDLAGRSVLGTLSQPEYGINKSGRVVIQITVNAEGAVVGAEYRAVGSTTNDSELIRAAQRAARVSKFSKLDGDGLQTGTITYNFKLK